ncbi:MAG: helix-turn-helix domain-containing protein [Prevotella sp.]|nr:helix-turn-helix domain-containing protein [Prevotella sp.]
MKVESPNPAQLLLCSRADIHAIVKEALDEAMAEYEERKNASASQRPYFTKKEVMEMFGIGTTTVWNWEKADYLRPTKVGRKVLYSVDEVNRVLTDKGRNSNESERFKRFRSVVRQRCPRLATLAHQPTERQFFQLLSLFSDSRAMLDTLLEVDSSLGQGSGEDDVFMAVVRFLINNNNT